MRKIVETVVAGLVLVALVVIGFVQGVTLSPNQLETVKILGIICGSAAAYCFIVGEITRNNSQMDKLWSVLPIAYVWVVAAKGGFSLRLIIMAILVTFWGARLTYNFAKKGAYSIKFWTGEEDYRWPILRATKPFNNKIVWGIFDLLFISIFQNVVVLGTTLPMVVVMESTKELGVVDFISMALVLGFFALEVVSDYQQNAFQTKKYEYLNSGMKLEELPAPYNRGFCTSGIWKYSRHPNYLGEQGIWVSLYLFTLGAGVNFWICFNWSLFGCALLMLVFLGSSRMSEALLEKKYKEYPEYQKQVFRYIPLRGYKNK